MSSKRIKELREAFESSRRKGKQAEAIAALVQLARLEPEEPRWPHQEGEAQRRLGNVPAAVDAFARASRIYAAGGFLARAVAMAKMLLSLDPSRTDVLESVDPSAAKEAHRKLRPAGVAETFEALPPRSSVIDTAALLRRDESVEVEVRFLEEPEHSVVELDITDLEMLDEPSEPDAPVTTLALLPSFPLLSELPQARLAQLARAADLVELPAGSLVLKKGDPADALYLIAEGEVAVRVEGLEAPTRLGEGDVFGESCLLAGASRGADVAVQKNLVALRIERADLEALVDAEPSLGALLFELLARRLVKNLVRTSPLFTSLPPADRLALARRFQLRRAPDGLALLERGKRGDALYLLVQGSVRVDADGATQRLGPGTVLGAEGLLGDAPASLDAHADGECVLLRLPRDRFTTLAAAYPPALEYLSSVSLESPSADAELDPVS